MKHLLHLNGTLCGRTDVHEISLYKQKWFETSLKIVAVVEKISVVII
jgi:hypothetical protein